MLVSLLTAPESVIITGLLSLWDVEEHLCFIRVWRGSRQFHNQCVQQRSVSSQNHMLLLTDSILHIIDNLIHREFQRVVSTFAI